jgi:hypothetical protein
VPGPPGAELGGGLVVDDRADPIARMHSCADCATAPSSELEVKRIPARMGTAVCPRRFYRPPGCRCAKQIESDSEIGPHVYGQMIVNVAG